MRKIEHLQFLSDFKIANILTDVGVKNKTGVVHCTGTLIKGLDHQKFNLSFKQGIPLGCKALNGAVKLQSSCGTTRNMIATHSLNFLHTVLSRVLTRLTN